MGRDLGVKEGLEEQRKGVKGRTFYKKGENCQYKGARNQLDQKTWLPDVKSMAG